MTTGLSIVNFMLVGISEFAEREVILSLLANGTVSFPAAGCRCLESFDSTTPCVQRDAGVYL